MYDYLISITFFDIVNTNGIQASIFSDSVQCFGRIRLATVYFLSQ
jgi:hypothetical protein